MNILYQILFVISLSTHLSSLIQNDFDQVLSLKMTMSIVNVHIYKEDIEQKHVYSLPFSFSATLSVSREGERELDMKNIYV